MVIPGATLDETVEITGTTSSVLTGGTGATFCAARFLFCLTGAAGVSTGFYKNYIIL